MRLFIVSHTPHYRIGTGWAAWGATVREVDALATLFAEVVHLAPAYEEAAPASALPYQARNVRVEPVRPAGGRGWAAKACILLRYPGYAWAIRRGFRHADAVHVRCPANLSLLAACLLGFSRKPRRRWIKYAGNWRPDGAEPLSYRLQRAWLERGWHGGVVTVNGEWPGQPRHVRSFYNPCLTQAELDHARSVAARKVLTEPLRLLFVGRLEEAKGVGRCLEILRRFQATGGKAVLDLVGDGPNRGRYEATARDMGLGASVRFHGWLGRTDLDLCYERTHVALLPSLSEGWPKVLSEAMAFGVVPLAGRVGCIGPYLEQFGTGEAVEVRDLDGFVRRLSLLVAHPDGWEDQSRRAALAAGQFTYERHLERVREILELPSGVQSMEGHRHFSAGSGRGGPEAAGSRHRW